MNETRRLLIATLMVLIFCTFVASAYAYSSDKYYFSINQPESWTVDDTTESQTVLFYGPTDQNTQASFKVQIGILPEGETLEQWVSEGKESLQQNSPNLVFISERSRTINGLSAYELVFNTTDQNGTLTFTQVCLANETRWAIMTYTALPIIYEKYLSSFQSSVETFSFIQLPDTTILGLEPELWAIIIVTIVGAIVTAAVVVRERKHHKTS